MQTTKPLAGKAWQDVCVWCLGRQCQAIDNIEGVATSCPSLTSSLPYCASHTLSLLHLSVRASSITAAGGGLYAALPTIGTLIHSLIHYYFHTLFVLYLSSPLLSNTIECAVNVL
jgi:hypothetical protein